MTMPVRLTIDDDDRLHVSPAGDYESLRGEGVSVAEMILPANEEVVLDNVKGDALEIRAALDPKESSVVEINVLRSPDRREFTRILFYKNRGYRDYSSAQGTLPVTSAICLDNSRSSLLPDPSSRVPETAYVSFEKDELVDLHIFVDRSIVEVFVNGRQFVAERAYPSLAESAGVSIRAQGQPAILKSLSAWQMKDIFE
jgi:beta-fructofuranosidase